MLPVLLALAPLFAAQDPDPAQAAVALARRELAARVGSQAAEAELVSVSRLSFLGGEPSCDRAALSAVGAPNGHRVLLRAGSRVYPVHVAAGRALVCEGLAAASAPAPEPALEGERDERPAIALPAGDAQRRLVEQAKQDLARRLSVTEGEIQLVEFEQVMWRDASLGCPRPGMMYAQVVREGFRIGLRAGKRGFAYHSGGGEPFLCTRPAKR